MPTRLLLAWVCGLAAPLWGTAVAASPVIPRKPANLQERVESWLVLQYQALRGSGVAVAVVKTRKDGNPESIALGTGVADLRSPVYGPTTSFRVGSISKVITWIRLLQLVEQGVWQLDDPINSLLPPHLRIDDGEFREPIRLSHLLGHTSGLEEPTLARQIVRTPEAVRALQEFLEQFQPRRVRAPGGSTAYSNFGPAFVGAALEHTIGADFAVDVEQSVFTPLGMLHSTFVDELPASSTAGPQGYPARGLIWRDTVWDAQDQYASLPTPATSLRTSAGDMALFMGDLLDRDRSKLLEPSSIDLLFQPLVRNQPGMLAVCHGLMELDVIHGHRAFGHLGWAPGFRASMILLPDLGLGVFVANNSEHGGGLGRQLATELVAAYSNNAPPERTPSSPPANLVLQGYEGEYLPLARPESTREKVLALRDRRTVTLGENQTLELRSRWGTSTWRPISPELFQSATDDQRLGFELTPAGQARFLFAANGNNSFERVGFFGGLTWLVTIFGAGLVLNLLTTLLPTKSEDPDLRSARRARRSIRYTAAAWALGALASLAAAIRMDFLGPVAWDNFPGIFVNTMVVLWSGAAVASVLNVVLVAQLWWTRSGPRWRRTWDASVVATSLAWAATLHHWNLLWWAK